MSSRYRRIQRLMILAAIIGAAGCIQYQALASAASSTILQYSHGCILTDLFCTTNAHTPASGACLVANQSHSWQTFNAADSNMDYDPNHPGSTASPYRVGRVVLFNDGYFTDPNGTDYPLYNRGFNDYDTNEANVYFYTTNVSPTLQSVVPDNPFGTFGQFNATGTWIFTTDAAGWNIDDTGEDFALIQTGDIQDSHTFNVKSSCP